MPKDETETMVELIPACTIRRVQQAVINVAPVEELVEETWTTEELARDFDVISFMAPYVIVRRKKDGVKGSLMFKHSPRVYFNWKEA